MRFPHPLKLRRLEHKTTFMTTTAESGGTWHRCSCTMVLSCW